MSALALATVLIARRRAVAVTPIVASLLLHAAAYGAIAMMPKFTAAHERVFIAELVEPDPTPPPTVVAPPRPRASDRRPLTPPDRIETPMPAPATEPSAEAPLPLPPVAQEAPAVSAVPRASVPLAAPPVTTGEGLPAAPAGRTAPAPAPEPVLPSAPAGPSMAALPPEGVTRTAAPRGGYQAWPSYPANARRLGIQGTTLLSVFVAVDGRVGDVVVQQSAGHPDLDRAAADAVKRWRFEPARRGAEAVAIWVLLPVEFRLR